MTEWFVLCENLSKVLILCNILIVFVGTVVTFESWCYNLQGSVREPNEKQKFSFREM